MLSRRALVLFIGTLLCCFVLPEPSAVAAPRGRRRVEKRVKVVEEEMPPPPPPVPEAPPNPALPHIVKGHKLFQDKQYDQAITELRAAYSLDPQSRLLFSIGSAQRRAGQLKEALATYRQYLQVDANGELKDKAQAQIAALNEAIADQERRNRPFYKKGWFWGVVAGVAVAAGVGVGLGLAFKPSTPQTDRGIYVLNF